MQFHVVIWHQPPVNQARLRAQATVNGEMGFVRGIRLTGKEFESRWASLKPGQSELIAPAEQRRTKPSVSVYASEKWRNGSPFILSHVERDTDKPHWHAA